MTRYRLITSNIDGYQPILRVNGFKSLFCAHRSIIDFVKVRREGGTIELCLMICNSCGKYWEQTEDFEYLKERIDAEILKIKVSQDKLSRYKEMLPILPEESIKLEYQAKVDVLESKLDVLAAGDEVILEDSYRRKKLETLTRKVVLKIIIESYRKKTFSIRKLHKKHFSSYKKFQTGNLILRMFDKGILGKKSRGLYFLNSPYNEYDEMDVANFPAEISGTTILCGKDVSDIFERIGGKISRKDLINKYFKGVPSASIDTHLSKLRDYGVLIKVGVGLYELANTNSSRDRDEAVIQGTIG